MKTLQILSFSLSKGDQNRSFNGISLFKTHSQGGFAFSSLLSAPKDKGLVQLREGYDRYRGASWLLRNT